MATLTNTQISVTYVGLLKTSGNTILDTTPQQITDGSGNNSQLFLSTAKVGIGATPSGSELLQISGDVTLGDSNKIKFGNSGDMSIFHNATDSFIENQTGILKIQSSVVDGDISFLADNGSGTATEYFRLDGGDTVTRVSRNFRTNDGVAFQVGASGDCGLFRDGTDSFLSNDTGDLYIKNNTNDKDIIFQSDNGSGGVATYFSVDGGGTDINFFKDTHHIDNVKAKFGSDSSGDLQIYHDGTDSFIDDAGTGDLRIRSNFLKIEKYTGETMATFNDDNSVALYFNNSVKFETSTTGATVTGALDVNSGTTDTAANFTSSDASVAVNFVASDNSMQIATSGTDGLLKNNGAGSLRFFNNGSERVRIDSSGSLGIGTSSPSAALDVTGRIAINDGNNNVSIGDSAGTSVTTGVKNTIIGGLAGDALTTGTGNTTLGYQALSAEDTLDGNTAIGFESLKVQDGGSFNTTLGYQSGLSVSTGDENTFLGAKAGDAVTTGSNLTVIGFNAAASAAGANDEITLGDANVDTLRCGTQTISALSDERDKTNIQESTYGLDFINKLNPVTFDWNTRDGSKKGKKDLGFIAQELDQIDDEYTQLVYKSNPEKLEASYGRLVPVLVKAIQELKAEIQELKNK